MSSELSGWLWGQRLPSHSPLTPIHSWAPWPFPEPAAGWETKQLCPLLISRKNPFGQNK